MIFCSPTFLDSSKLYQLLASVIDLDASEFAGVYQELRSSFARTSESPLLDDFVRKPVALINPVLIPGTNIRHPGIDLPCWIQTSNPHQTIVLLGQDPLRDDTYFGVPSENPYIVIGTPYSVHSRSLRQWRSNPRYWAPISELLNAGYRLYLTDIFKFWFRGQRVGPSAEAAYRTLLHGELSLLASAGPPPIVVAFGQRAAAFLLGPQFAAGRKIANAKAEIFAAGTIRVLPVLHPSPQNARILPDYLRANDVDPTKGTAGLAEVIAKAVSHILPAAFDPIRSSAYERPNVRAGIVVEVMKIDGSRPAVRPSERGEAYQIFFQELIDELREQHSFTSARVAGARGWYPFASGTTGVSYGFTFGQGSQVRAEIYLNMGDQGVNKSLFDTLEKEKSVLENAFGEPLRWERLNDRKGSRIAVYRPGTIEDSSEVLTQTRRWAIERLLRLKKVFGPTLIELTR